MLANSPAQISLTTTGAGAATLSANGGLNIPTPNLSAYVPTTVTVNGHALSANVTIAPADLVLTGYVSGTGTISATDNVLQAIQKLNGNAALYAPLAGATFTGIVSNPSNAICAYSFQCTNNASTITWGVSNDVIWHRPSAGVIAQYSGAQIQEFQIFSTYTDSTHSSKLFAGRYASSYHCVGTEGNSASGSGGGLKIQTSNASGVATDAVTIDTSQNVTIAAASTLYTTTINNAGNIYNSSSGGYGWQGRGWMFATGDGVFALYNNGQTGFSKLQLGPNNTAPTSVSIVGGSASAGNSNVNGASVTIATGQSTGSGTGSLIFQTTAATAGATSQNSLVTALTIASDLSATFAGDISLNGNNTFVRSAGSNVAEIDAIALQLHSRQSGNWYVRLVPNASHVLAMQYLTNAQEFQVYGTYTSSTSYERFVVRTGSTGSNVIIGTEKGSGGGAACGLTIETGGVTAATVSTSQTWTFANSIIVTNSISVGNSNTVSWNSGNSYVFGNASTGANVGTTRIVASGGVAALNFGGDTSSYPALKQVGANLAARLADDSAYCGFSVGSVTHADGGNIILGTTTGSQIGTAASQKLSLWGKTPIVQPTTSITAATFVAGTSGISNDSATWGGYTLGQLVQACKNFGLVA